MRGGRDRGRWRGLGGFGVCTQRLSSLSAACPRSERQDSRGKTHTAGWFFFIVKDTGCQRGQRSEDVTLLLHTPIRSWEGAGRVVPVLNLLSMSDSFQNIQTYLK